VKKEPPRYYGSDPEQLLTATESRDAALVLVHEFARPSRGGMTARFLVQADQQSGKPPGYAGALNAMRLIKAFMNFATSEDRQATQKCFTDHKGRSYRIGPGIGGCPRVV
jgi:hypothetical protein